jgi:hypothetical protein
MSSMSDAFTNHNIFYGHQQSEMYRQVTTLDVSNQQPTFLKRGGEEVAEGERLVAAKRLMMLREYRMTTSYNVVAKMDFNNVGPEHFISKELFQHYKDRPQTLERLHAITVMVISYLRTAGRRPFLSNLSSIQRVFINHLQYWYSEINGKSVKIETDSYLCDEVSILLNAIDCNFSNAVKNARVYIKKMMDSVKISMTESIDLRGFINSDYKDVLMYSMECHFEKLNYESECMGIISNIIKFISNRFTTLVLLAKDGVVE